jgi:hypothetical protein
MIWIAVGLIGAAVVFGIGALVQGVQGSEGTITGPSVPPPVACDDYCRDLILARTIRCNAEARLRDLRDTMDTINQHLTRALTLFGILLAAAVAAGAIPFAGWISASLQAAAWTTFAIMVFLTGMLAVAIKHFEDQKEVAQGARNREARALADMMGNCSADEQTKCLARLTPCP